MKKTIGFTLLGLVIGIGLGSIFTMAYYGHKVAKAMFILQEAELIRNEDAAIQAYLILQRHLATQSLYFPLKSEALNPKSETISNVQNPNFQNKTTDGPAIVV